MFNWADSALTWRFTGSSPTMRSSSLSASSSRTGSVGPVGSGGTGTEVFSRTESPAEGSGPVGGSPGSDSFRSRPSAPNSGSSPSGPSSASCPPDSVIAARSVTSSDPSYPSESVIAASRAEVSMNAGSTRCTARYRGSAAALRPVPSWARASQYRSSLRCGCSLRQRISAEERSGSAWPYISSRTRAIPPNNPASMPRSWSLISGSVCRTSCSQSLTR